MQWYLHKMEHFGRAYALTIYAAALEWVYEGCPLKKTLFGL